MLDPNSPTPEADLIEECARTNTPLPARTIRPERPVVLGDGEHIEGARRDL